jgi:hypothetical protein
LAAGDSTICDYDDLPYAVALRNHIPIKPRLGTGGAVEALLRTPLRLFLVVYKLTLMRRVP